MQANRVRVEGRRPEQSDELPGVARDVFASSFFFLLCSRGAPSSLRPLKVKRKKIHRRMEELGAYRRLIDISSLTVTIVQGPSF